MIAHLTFFRVQIVQVIYLSLLASSMKGLFSTSVSIFHSAPSRLEISELCIFGLSCAILRRWPLDQTMNAFMGLLMWSFDDEAGKDAIAVVFKRLTNVFGHW